jgi:hypothetical protein
VTPTPDTGEERSLWVNKPVSPHFRLEREVNGAAMTSDVGLLLPRELGERLGPSTLIERHLTDPRSGRNFQFPLPGLCRQFLALSSAQSEERSPRRKQSSYLTS